ncbi:uncharacterized protein LOC115952671 isoform X1 [Quercus lobata]|uniref:uncharacterized protein LOC115952671 isoform X1 n=1 Tax=Quercus lobata TaxID=97700 RepID=UPI001245BB6D|nr:uncharacterized protein LOC115952671 isoform X1 [Quercus lobata]
MVISLSPPTHLLSFPPPLDPSTTATHCTATYLPPPPTVQPPFAVDAGHRRHYCRPPISPLGSSHTNPTKEVLRAQAHVDHVVGGLRLGRKKSGGCLVPMYHRMDCQRMPGRACSSAGIVQIRY